MTPNNVLPAPSSQLPAPRIALGNPGCPRVSPISMLKSAMPFNKVSCMDYWSSSATLVIRHPVCRLVTILEAQNSSAGVMHCGSHFELGSHLQTPAIFRTLWAESPVGCTTHHCSIFWAVQDTFPPDQPPPFHCCPPTSKAHHSSPLIAPFLFDNAASNLRSDLCGL